MAAASNSPAVTATGTETVMIGCKLPTGMFMELIEPGTKITPRPGGRRVMLKGANTVALNGVNPGQHAFGLTEVDAAFAREWFKRHADWPMVKDGHVFIQKDLVHAQGAALDNLASKTKLEPLNPERDERTLSKIQVEADPDHLKKMRETAGNIL